MPSCQHLQRTYCTPAIVYDCALFQVSFFNLVLRMSWKRCFASIMLFIIMIRIAAVPITYSYGSPKVSRFSWRHKTILVAARPETWQFWSRRELHFSLLDEKLSILVATSCYEAPQDLLNSGRQTRQISSRREMSNISWREMRRGKRAERAMCIN